MLHQRKHNRDFTVLLFVIIGTTGIIIITTVKIIMKMMNELNYFVPL